MAKLAGFFHGAIVLNTSATESVILGYLFYRFYVFYQVYLFYQFYLFYRFYLFYQFYLFYRL